MALSLMLLVTQVYTILVQEKIFGLLMSHLHHNCKRPFGQFVNSVPYFVSFPLLFFVFSFHSILFFTLLTFLLTLFLLFSVFLSLHPFYHLLSIDYLSFYILESFDMLSFYFPYFFLPFFHSSICASFSSLTFLHLFLCL